MNYYLQAEIIGEHHMLLYQLLSNHVEYQKKTLSSLLSLLSLNDQNRCMARIHDKTQCTRKCKDIYSHLCGSHINSLPYGRIDDLYNPNEILRTNNGRKNKPIQDSNLIVDPSKYIKTELIKIDDKEFLIDQNNLLFDNSENHTLVGIKLGKDQYKWL